jgi:hypothetical protein
VAGRDTQGLPPLVVPSHALLVIEERLADQERDGVQLPLTMTLQELALRILAISHLARYRPGC